MASCTVSSASHKEKHKQHKSPSILIWFHTENTLCVALATFAQAPRARTRAPAGATARGRPLPAVCRPMTWTCTTWRTMDSRRSSGGGTMRSKSALPACFVQPPRMIARPCLLTAARPRFHASRTVAVNTTIVSDACEAFYMLVKHRATSTPVKATAVSDACEACCMLVKHCAMSTPADASSARRGLSPAKLTAAASRRALIGADRRARDRVWW